MNSPEQLCSEIQTRIKNLFPLHGDNLKNEMDSLKRVLLENPAACSLLLDEDVGALVTSLRRMTGQALASATAKKEAKPKKEKVNLTAAELAAALDEM